MENNCLIATVLNEHARVYIVNAKDIVEKARQYHDLYPTSCAALGRTLAVTALLGMMQKDENEAITVQINGGGPIGTILCVSSCDGHVKGFCGNPHFYKTYVDSPHKLAVGEGVGTNGYLKVITDLKLKQSYSSEVELQSGEIGDDFSYYLSMSKQVPNIVSVGVLVDVDYSVKSAGAMIIELLPGHTEEDIVYLENLNLKPISSVLANNDNIHDYLNSLFSDSKILEEKNIEYYCDCSRERFMANILTLPKKDIEELAQENSLEIRCEFCNKTYQLDKNDLNTILKYADRKN